MRRLGFTIVLSLAAMTMLSGQGGVDAKLQSQLKKLFPDATSFSPKAVDVPHYKAFSGDPKNQASLIGYAFWTTDLTPLERGYDGPIKVLVGMNTQAKLTGILVTEHKEPYGDFSIDTPQFQQQFRNKDIRDAFKIGGDIDAIARATISIGTVARSVRNSGRRIARTLLTPPSTQ